MNMQQISDRMDSAVQSLLDIHARDQTEATLIRTAASLLDKLNDRDMQINELRSKLDEMKNELEELKKRFASDGK